MLLTVRAAVAQSGAGSIQGTVTDSTNAVIPASSIHVVNEDTGVASDTKSNGVGFYQVPGLFAGNYRITVTAPGMKTYAMSLQLLVAQNAMINPTLTPGAVTQEVMVNSDAVQLTNNESATLDSTLERDRIDQLPINTRDVTTLVGQTTPGLEASGTKMNGLAAEALDYVIDGTTTKDSLYGGMHNSQAQFVDPDTIQEIKVQGQNSGAQYATPATAIATTKSGTNRLHGSLFETARNNAFGVALPKTNQAGASAPLIRNEFGMSAGGPIVLPFLYHGKNKSFWFFAYERFSLVSTNSAQSKVPTMAMRQGDFSGAINAAGKLLVLYDPATTAPNAKCPIPGATTGTTTANNPYCRTPYLNNQIPLTQMSPLAQVGFKLIPAPTNTAINPLIAPNYNANSKNVQIEPQITFRLDHQFNESNRVYVRYTQNIAATNTSGGARNVAIDGIPAGAAYGYANSPTVSYVTGAGYTHIFSPSFYSETILSQQWLGSKQLPGIASDVNYEHMLNLPNNFGEVGFPNIGNGNLITNLGTSQTKTAQSNQLVSTIDENLTKTWGRHQMVFGGRFRHDRNSNQPNGTADKIAFGNNSVALSDPSKPKAPASYAATGSADAAFFIGSAGSYNVNLEPPHLHYHLNELDAYFQDNYHLKKNLTVNLGLRYEAHPSLWTKDQMGMSFDLKNDALVLSAPTDYYVSKGYTTQSIINNNKLIGVKFETPAQAGMPDTLMKNYYLNFLPRLGVAYLPFSGKWGTVIRGGYGVYTYPTPLEDYANHTSANNPFTAAYTMSYSAAAQAVDGLQNELLRYNGPVKFGIAGLNTANVVDTSSPTAILPGLSPFVVSPDWKPTYTTQANLTIEQPLKGHSVVRASYVFTHASNLDVIYHPNVSPSDYQWFMGTGLAKPSGTASVIGTPQANTYAGTGMGPYDQTTWGNIAYHERTGFSNYNGLQVNYQRLYHHGYAYQVSYVWAKAFRVGGNQDLGLLDEAPYANYPGVLGSRGKMTSPYGVYTPGFAPPTPPVNSPAWADYSALARFQQYQQDSNVFPMHIKLNWVVDLPVGRGKRFLGNANRFVNELIGGFQFAGSSNISTSMFQVNTSGHWGQTSPLKIYKHQKPITDCTSGVCEKSYLWYNGYISPKQIQDAPGSTCGLTGTCVSGLPADYKPVQAPIMNDATDTVNAAYFGTDDVVVTLADGSQTTIAYDGGARGSGYLEKTWLQGPINWPINASLYKVFPIKEGMFLRVNLDAFNALNSLGENNPDTGTGIQHFRTNGNTPRQLQITARFSF
jgi:hypothetical protein